MKIIDTLKYEIIMIKENELYNYYIRKNETNMYYLFTTEEEIDINIRDYIEIIENIERIEMIIENEKL